MTPVPATGAVPNLPRRTGQAPLYRQAHAEPGPIGMFWVGFSREAVDAIRNAASG